jgi:hypothetical protein
LLDEDGANLAHARLFYEQLLPMMQNSGPSWKLSLSTCEKYDRIMDAMVRIRTGDKMGEVRATYPQAYKWRKTYALVNNGVGGFILVNRPPDAFGLNRDDDVNVDVNSVVQLTYFEAAYSNIRKCHLPDHTKGRTLYARVCQSYSNIDRSIRYASHTPLAQIVADAMTGNTKSTGLADEDSMTAWHCAVNDLPRRLCDWYRIFD